MKKLFILFKRKVNKYKLNQRYKKISSKILSDYVSSDIKIGRNCLIDECVKIGENVRINDFSYLNSNSNWSIIESNVIIGKFCSIAPNVFIGLGNHNYDYISTHPFLYNNCYGFKKNNTNVQGVIDDEKYTIIENDVWIGANANIKRGVKINNGAVIGMNAVVTKDVPAYSIVVGNPAKVIGYRFNDEEIQYLQKIEWWNLDYMFIKDNINHFYSVKDLKKLLNK